MRPFYFIRCRTSALISVAHYDDFQEFLDARDDLAALFGSVLLVRMVMIYDFKRQCVSCRPGSAVCASPA